ncbi:MAG: molybdopterin-dependent oxidoreductase [Rhodobacteraceae bacterium]|nr:molybdopterin-dependent oxidoreductase [Paracoccaceae bacterium]MCF8514161.1 molybdopterin-dependent oxidoreductase [Paracoccaceae bacterium]MCF8518405.1 molybdopterin-dependent oxidoreductase [Paracoccaceae bacterium]
MNSSLVMGRRGFLAATGFLALSFAVPHGAFAAGDSKLPSDLEKNPMLNSWIRINSDGTVTLLIGKVELGQGAVTMAAQCCADELMIDINRLNVISGDTRVCPDEGTTAGSQSAPYCAPAVQQASADVRLMLTKMAAEKLGAKIEDLVVEDGMISAPGGAHVTYWELVTGDELNVAATGEGHLIDPMKYRYMGKSVIRLDIPAKMTGDKVFIQETNPEGVKYGAVARPPTYKATLVKADIDRISAMPGVLKVVQNGSFLGVIADHQDQAWAAAVALETTSEWKVESVLPTSDGIFDWLKTTPSEVTEWVNTPRVGGGDAAKVIENEYMRPYHMHGSIGTSAAIAQMGADGVMTIHTASQSVFSTATAIQKMLGLEEGKVQCVHTQGSGCYGHNNADDASADAALLAAAMPGTPIKLQYTREQEHAWEPYGSAMVMQTKAGVDADGNILDWNMEIYSTPHGTRPGGNPGNLLSARYLETPFEMPTPKDGGAPNYAATRNGIPAYTFPGTRVATHYITEMPLRVSSTRGLGAYANVFAIESFMDELARNAGADPVEYRLRYLEDPRARDVLTKCAETFGWDTWEARPGFGRGIAFARYKNLAAYTAVAVEVQVTARNGRVRVVRAVAANDSGQMINPDGITNQIEGGLIQSLSWTLKEEVKFDDTKVLSRDWASYPIITFNEVPPVTVALIDRPGEPFLGTGESSQGPTSAAVGNAVFDAVGARVTRLPMTPDRVKAAMKA